MFRIATALIFLSPAIAPAECLTPASLDTGITVEYGNGNISHIQRQPDGSILDAFSDTDSYYKETIIFTSVDGVIENHWKVFPEDSWEARSATGKTYDFTPESQPDYAANASASGTVTWSENDYYSGSKTFSWFGYESEPVIVGECSYDAVRIFTYEFSITGENFFIREVKFLPELGIGVQLGNSYFNWSSDNAVIVSMTAS